MEPSDPRARALHRLASPCAFEEREQARPTLGDEALEAHNQRVAGDRASEAAVQLARFYDGQPREQRRER
jgi:hypothetical protein